MAIGGITSGDLAARLAALLRDSVSAGGKDFAELMQEIQTVREDIKSEEAFEAQQHGGVNDPNSKESNRIAGIVSVQLNHEEYAHFASLDYSNSNNLGSLSDWLNTGDNWEALKADKEKFDKVSVGVASGILADGKISEEEKEKLKDPHLRELFENGLEILREKGIGSKKDLDNILAAVSNETAKEYRDAKKGYEDIWNNPNSTKDEKAEVHKNLENATEKVEGDIAAILNEQPAKADAKRQTAEDIFVTKTSQALDSLLRDEQLSPEELQLAINKSPEIKDLLKNGLEQIQSKGLKAEESFASAAKSEKEGSLKEIKKPLNFDDLDLDKPKISKEALQVAQNNPDVKKAAESLKDSQDMGDQDLAANTAPSSEEKLAENIAPETKTPT